MGTEVHKRIAMEIKTLFERELECFDFLDYLEVAKDAADISAGFEAPAFNCEASDKRY